MQVLQLTAGVGAELVGQQSAGPLVALQRLRGPAGRGEGAHQGADQRLVQRVGAHQRLELGHQRGAVTTQLSEVHAFADHRTVQGGPPGAVAGGVVGFARVAERFAPPQLQGGRQPVVGAVQVAGGPAPASLGQPLGQDRDVEVGRGDGQPVAAHLLVEDGSLAERPAQARDQGLQGVGRIAGRVGLPHRVQQLGRGHPPPGFDGQSAEQGAQPGARDDQVAVGDLHLEGTEKS